MIWMVNWIFDEVNYINDEIFMLIDNVLSCVAQFLDNDLNIFWWGERGEVDKMMIIDNNLAL